MLLLVDHNRMSVSSKTGREQHAMDLSFLPARTLHLEQVE